MKPYAHAIARQVRKITKGCCPPNSRDSKEVPIAQSEACNQAANCLPKIREGRIWVVNVS